MKTVLFALLMIPAFAVVRGEPEAEVAIAATPGPSPASAVDAATEATPEATPEPTPEPPPGHAPGPGRYRGLWNRSPFLRPLNAAESYFLTGVAYFDGKPMVTIVNTATGERISLTTEENSLGWRLLGVHSDPNPRNITARVVINGEEVGLHFNERQLTPEALMKAGEGSRRSQPFSTPRAPGSILRERLPRNAQPASTPKARPNQPRKKRQNPSQP